MGYGERLRRERQRLGMTQGDFAALVGTDSQKQSLYETSKRELRGDYLNAIANAGIDVLFVLTGRYSGGDALAPDETTLIERFRRMDETDRGLLRALADRMSPS